MLQDQHEDRRISVSRPTAVSTTTRLVLARCGIVEVNRLNVIWDINLWCGSIWLVRVPASIIGYGLGSWNGRPVLQCSGHISTGWP